MTTPILPQPPKKSDPAFDDWMFRMWKVLVPAANGAAVWSQTDKSASLPLYEGNRKAGPHLTASWYMGRATQGLRRGKWFWEVLVGNGSNLVVGVATSAATTSNYLGFDSTGWGYYSVDGKAYNNASSAAYGNTYTGNDVIGVALDMNAGAIYFYKNGTIQNSGTAAFTGLTGTLYPAISCYDAGFGMVNFGHMPFAYSVPDGYNAGVF